MQYALRTTLEANEHIGVIIEQATRDVGAEVGGDFLDLETRHILDEVFGVRTDIANAVRKARAVRVHPPVGDLLNLPRLQGADGVTLWVFDEDLVDFAELPGGYEITGFLHHRIARVVVQQCKDQSALLNDDPELLRFSEGEREWLLADDVDARLEEGLGHGVVHIIARDDRDEINTVTERALGLGFRHFLVGGVNARCIEEEILTGKARLLGVRGERPGDEFNLAIKGRRHAVHAADEGATAATDHAHTKFAILSSHRN